MTLVALGSVRGAPGVSTLALLLAGGIEGTPVVEADLAGGVMSARYELGREPGLTTLAASRVEEPHHWREHAQSAGGVSVLVGPDAPESAVSLWRSAGDRLETALSRIDAPVVIADLGRIGARSPLLASADLTVIVVRPVAEHLVTLSHWLPTLSRVGSGRIALVLAGTGSYRAVDVSSELDVDVIGHVPDDPRAADALLRGGMSTRSLNRSNLVRTASAMSAELFGRVHGTAPAAVAR
jgi:hypothetical protein